ncbi:hypothetical protein C9F11_17800 [Streptomyces sp. YIM 121038]|uniref:hypothetical protein n=1 Tax=Streptomyces sp. YIM 121038 TaxID=2136401 RepID=UPI001162DA5D|nr:hypothetical protein [Streptomyces sp. YIM 121038]QCX77212.1 hypothetical protein C9F11_17800 [Streptomyces sp. YIM 121038]
MSAPGTTHLPSQGRELGTAAPFFPRLHELAADTAQDGRIGVVTALPDGERNTFRLASPVGGDQEWSAPADGTTLRPVPAKPTCATLAEPLGAVYDARAGQGSVRVLIHFEDGTQDEAVLILTPADMERLYAQTGRMLGDRDQHWTKT